MQTPTTTMQIYVQGHRLAITHVGNTVEVLHADSSMPGPRTVLIAGQHGDEAAGPMEVSS
jgi:predicted deacylase